MSFQTAQEKLTQEVIEAFAGTPEPRLRELMTALVKHVHAYAREVDLTPAEWLAGMKFLAAVGEISTPMRPEFILLSDVLGLSSMVVALEQARASGANAKGATEATEATVEGPFYWPGAPELPLGSDIGEGVKGEPALYMGRVTDVDGNPVADALLDVWSGDGAGRYDMQAENPQMQARARFRSDAEGRYWFWSIRPNFYPVPDDGPVGAMMRATNRSIYRPAHLHFQVSAPGYVPLTTQLFVADSPYLKEDAVFGTRESLIYDFDTHPPGKAVDGREMKMPYHSCSFDIRLAPVPA